MSSLGSATSMPPESELNSDAVEHSWEETVELRLSDVREGRVRTMSGEEVFAALGAIVDLR